MVCYNPLSGWMREQCKSNGKKAIVFGNPPSRGKWKRVFLPCGQCIGCRLAKSREWALRCMHESKQHFQNCYLTLTYNDDTVPWSTSTGEQTLRKKDLQDFMKRLRFYLHPHKVRFFACGEYGETTHRPHYHIILFGYDFPDKKLFTLSKDGFPYYTSDFLNSIWKQGHCLVADVSFETCAYVARYVTKKLTGEAGKEAYEGIQPEFVNMSRRPGIGKDWFDLYKTDLYPYDEAILSSNGKTRVMRVPRYYDKLLEQEDPELLASIKEKRLERGELKAWELCQRDRLQQKEKYQENKTKDFKRSGF